MCGNSIFSIPLSGNTITMRWMNFTRLLRRVDWIGDIKVHVYKPNANVQNEFAKVLNADFNEDTLATRESISWKEITSSVYT